MKSKHLRRRIERQSFNIAHELRQFFDIWDVVSATLTEFVVVLENFWSYVSFQNGFYQPHVFVICNSAAIVDLCAKVVEDFEGNHVVLVQKHFQLSLADPQVFIGEFIGDIPTDRTKLSAVLNDCMEEAKTEQQLFIFLRLLAVVELLV